MRWMVSGPSYLLSLFRSGSSSTEKFFQRKEEKNRLKEKRDGGQKFVSLLDVPAPFFFGRFK